MLFVKLLCLIKDKIVSNIKITIYKVLKWAQEVDNYNEAGLVKNKKKQISLCGFYSIAMMMNGTQLRFMFW